MSLGHGANVVTNGLVLYLDAANVKSYPGAGTSWNDLSGNNRNGLINDSPVINSNSFTFDGVDDSISFPGLVDLSDTNVVTISFWCKLNSYVETVGGAGGILLEATDNYNNSTVGFLIVVSDDGAGFNGDFPVTLGIKGDAEYNVYGYDKNSVNDLQWHHWTCIFNKGVNGTNPIESEFYIDGVYKPVTSFPDEAVPLRQDNTNNFGETTFYIGGRQGTSFNLDFDLGTFSIYNRKLSAAEIQQNFNALLGRYGV